MGEEVQRLNSYLHVALAGRDRFTAFVNMTSDVELIKHTNDYPEHVAVVMFLVSLILLKM
jgi:hypothetical protein